MFANEILSNHIDHRVEFKCLFPYNGISLLKLRFYTIFFLFLLNFLSFNFKFCFKNFHKTFSTCFMNDRLFILINKMILSHYVLKSLRFCEAFYVFHKSVSWQFLLSSEFSMAKCYQSFHLLIPLTELTQEVFF